MELQPYFILMDGEGRKTKVPVTIAEMDSEQYDIGVYYIKKPHWAESSAPTIEPELMKIEAE